MFQSIQEPAKKPRKSVKDVFWQFWRRSRYLWLVLVFLSLAGGIYSYTLWQQTISDDCDRYAAPKIDFRALIDMKDRLAAYQHDRSEDAYLSLSAEELGFVIYTKTEILGKYSFSSEGLVAQLTVPRPNGSCYNVDFVGQLDSRRGRIEIQPAHIVVGDLDMTRWFQPSYTVNASSFGQAAEDTFSNITSISITGTEAKIRLRNRQKIW